MEGGSQEGKKKKDLSWVLILRIIILEFWLIHLFSQIWPPSFYFSRWPFQDTWSNSRSTFVIVTSLGLTGSTVICFYYDFCLFLPSSVLCECAQSACFSSLFFCCCRISEWSSWTDSVIVLCWWLMDLLQTYSRTYLLPSLLAQLSLTEIWIEFRFFYHSNTVSYLLSWCIWKGLSLY